MTTRLFSYALKGKLPGGRCLVIVGTEGIITKQNSESKALRIKIIAWEPVVRNVC
jgi:hypothetical protein